MSKKLKTNWTDAEYIFWTYTPHKNTVIKIEFDK